MISSRRRHTVALWLDKGRAATSLPCVSTKALARIPHTA